MNFLKVDDFIEEEVYGILDRADALEDRWNRNRMPRSLEDKKIALWFYGHGFRNRVAFEIGARAMGANVSFIPGELGVHEPIEDVGSYLRNWFDMLVIRCQRHADLERVARDAGAPVINARTSFNHPCEILGDLQYIRRKRGSLDGLKVVFAGETTNLCMSWFEAARVLPIRVVQAGPAEYLASPNVVKAMNEGARGAIETTVEFPSPVDAETDVLYTDCWPRSGDKARIRELFLPYRITRKTVERMHPKGFFMPCPPVTRGEELSDDSLSDARFCDYEAKEYLLHAQNAIMEHCFNERAHHGN